MRLFGLKHKAHFVKKGGGTLKEYLRIAENNPEDPGIQQKIADLYLKQGKVKEAIAAYLRAVQGYTDEGSFQLAASIYKQILSLKPDMVEIYLKLANLHCQEGFLGDAVAVYEQLANYYLSEGFSENAHEVAVKIKNLDPQNPYIIKKAAKFFNSDKSGAETLNSSLIPVEEIKENFSPPSAIPAQLVEAKEGKGVGIDEVFQEIRKGMQKETQEESPELHYDLGIAFLKTNKIDEAIFEFYKVIEIPSKRNLGYLMLSICFRKKGLFREAMKYSMTGLKAKNLSKEEYLNLNYELGLIYTAMGKKEKALKVFKGVSKAFPKSNKIQEAIRELSRS